LGVQGRPVGVQGRSVGADAWALAPGGCGREVQGRCRVGRLGCRVGRLGCRVGRLGVQGRRLGAPSARGRWARPREAPPRRWGLRELASRFLAKPIQMSSAGLGNPPKSPPGRAGHCTQAGGYMRRERAEQRPAWEQQYSSNGILGGSWAAAAAVVRSRSAGRVRGARRLVCELASRFLAKPIQMSFAGLGNPPKSPLGRAPHCTPAGGYMRKEQTSSCGGDVEAQLLAPLHGGLRRPLSVPFHTSPLSRGALRSAGGPTIAASTTPAPRHPGSRQACAASGKTLQAQGNTPCAPRGGLCG